jgi:peptidoglycan/LPS O-acetylase OafA/YrhL
MLYAMARDLSAVTREAIDSGGDPVAVYRPHLDGLRAVAVYLVVLFHAGSSVFTGGYIGVDVFFVLSGFLVTQLLLRDIAGQGSIRFGRFYARRFRRLLPAAFVTLIVTAIVFTAIASPAEVLDSVGSFKAAFLYVTNWYFIHHATGYFGADLTANPILHFWSLAVEEQFYLLWPLVLGGGFFATRRLERTRQIRVLRIAVFLGAVASAVWALSLSNSNPNRAYYGTDARAYELLAGALLALVPGFIASLKRYRRSVHAASILSIVHLVFLATSLVNLNAIQRGISATITTCAFLMAIETADGGLVQRLLSNQSVVYLGQISYGTYLWHWIVILVTVRTFHPQPTATIAIASLIATALAALSYAMLEHPIRLSSLLDRHRRAVIAGGLIISVVSAIIVIPKVVDTRAASTTVVQGSKIIGFTPVPVGLDWQHASAGVSSYVDCYQQSVDTCTIRHGTGPHILLVGDSAAQMFRTAFVRIAYREHLTLSVSVRGLCPWQRDLYVDPGSDLYGKGGTPAATNAGVASLRMCQAQKNDLYDRVIPALHPDIIVAVNREYPRQNLVGPDGKIPTTGFSKALGWPEAATQRAVTELRANSPNVIEIEPIPVAVIDPIECLSGAKVLEDCRYVVAPEPDRLELFSRQLARKDKNFRSVDLDRLVCPYLPVCDPVVNNQIVKYDRVHLTTKFVASITPQIEGYLKQEGLITR